MGDNTAIEWTDATLNAVVGCSRVSEGCRHCYAERLAATRLKHTERYKGLAVVRANGEPQWTGEARLVDAALHQALRWRRGRRIFLTAMGDPFHASLTDEDIAVLFGVMAACPQHTFQVLTKRPERARAWFERAEKLDLCGLTVDRLVSHGFGAVGCGSAFDPQDWPLPNVWMGTSVENQAAADERIPHLLATPAAVRFLSCEPLLAPVDLREHIMGYVDDDVSGGRHVALPHRTPYFSQPKKIHWVIAGGESGHGARPMHPAWARELRGQCSDAGVAFFFKQWGEWRSRDLGSEGPDGWERVRLSIDGKNAQAEDCDSSNDVWMERSGKKLAGRMLDGREWSEFPGVQR